MPLVRVEVRNEYGLGAPELYREANKEDPKEILEGISVAGLVGVLRQLGDLADFAAEVFHSLQDEVMITSSRSHKLLSRVQRIEAALSPLEKAVLAQRSHLHLAYTDGSNWHTPIRCETNQFLYSDAPQFILDSYEECRGPPRLHMLDRFDPGGHGSCLKRYSDPSFFKRASVASGEASTEEDLNDKKGYNIKKRGSWPKNGEVSRAASFFYQSGRMQFTQFSVGGYTLPSQPMSTYDAKPRSDFSVQSNLDLRNGSGYSKEECSPSYSMQPKEQVSRDFISNFPVKRHESDYLDYNFLGDKVIDACEDSQITITQERGGCSSYYVTKDERTSITEPTMHEDDHDTNMESFDVETLEDNAVTFENVEKMHAQTCVQDLPIIESRDIYLDEFEGEVDNFMDALNTVEPESETDVDCTKKQAIDHYSMLEDKAADDGLPELMKHNFGWQTSNSQSNAFANGTLINVGCEHNSISMSPKFPSTASYTFRDHKSGTVIIDDRKNCPESQRHAPETSNVTSVTFWTNGGLLGLQPSKPPDCSLLNDLPHDRLSKEDGKIVSSVHNLILSDKDTINRTESSKNIKEGLDLDIDTSTGQEYQESGISFRKPFWKISPADLEVRIGKQGDLSYPNNADSTEASVTASGQPLGGNENSRHASYQTANDYEQKNHQNVAYRTFSGRIKDLSGGEAFKLSPSSSPPLVHMKMSFQPIDGFVTSKLKLKFLDGNTNDQSCRDIFPSFQLVPEMSLAQHDDGLDSDDDGFFRSSPSVSDDCNSHQCGSNSEQWENGGSPNIKAPDLYNSFREISLTESISTVSVQFPFVENSTQNSQSCSSLDLQSLDALNHSFREKLRNDTNLKDLVAPEFETTFDPPPLPPVEWRNMKPRLDDIKHSASRISQQPKPAPLYHDQILETTYEQKSKKFSSQNSNGQREANQGSNINKKDDFLHQIRSKSFNLRPTMPAKPTVPLGVPSNIQVTAILEKANAIRQAVGSDDGDEDGDWSDI